MTTGVHKAMARGVMWTSTARLVVRGLGLVSTFVLARLLEPADFGLVALAATVVALAELIRAFSFDAALIQDQQTTDDEYNTAWTLNVLLATGIGLVLALSSPLAAMLYRDPRITGVLLVLASSFVVTGFANTGTVNFRKHMDFRRDFTLMVVQKLGGFFVTLTLAFSLRSYWALAYGTLLSSVIGVLLSYWMHPFRPRFSLKSHGKLVGFSKWMLLSNFAAFLRDRTSQAMLGRFGTAQAVGVLTIAYEIAGMVTSELVAPINRAVQPGYAKLAANATALREGFTRVLAFIALFAFPAALGLAALAQPAVDLFLGEKWHAVGPIVQILAFAGAINAALTNSVSVYLAIGKPNVIALMAAIHTVFLVPMLAVGVLWYGASGAAWAHLLNMGLVAAPSTYYLLVRRTPITVGDIADPLWRPIIAAGIMYLAVRELCLMLAPRTAGQELLTVAAGILTGVAVYLVSILALWRGARCPDGAERILVERARALLRKPGRAPI